MHDPYNVNRPIYGSVTQGFPRATDPGNSFKKNLPDDGTFLYSRFCRHPNYLDLIASLSKMEGGESATLFASGIAATASLFGEVFHRGGHLVVSSRIYGGTRGQIQMLAYWLRIPVSVVDITDLKAVEAACREDTKLLFLEAISNPELAVADIAALSAICHGNGRNILLAVDNTFSALLTRPLLLGADIVHHSGTKVLNGESDAMAGALVGTKEFIDKLIHPRDGVAPLLGAVLHPPLAQMMATRFNYLEYRVREGSKRAFGAARLCERAGLPVHYPLLAPRPRDVLTGLGDELGGGVFSIAFNSVSAAEIFVNNAIKTTVHDPLLLDTPLAYAAVSLGSSHSYMWLTIEANEQGNNPKWPPLPFAKIPGGFVRCAMGWAGDHDAFLKSFERLLEEFGCILKPASVIAHT